MRHVRPGRQDLRAQYDADGAAAAAASPTPRGQLAAEANVVPGSGLAWGNGATCVGVVVKWGSQYPFSNMYPKLYVFFLFFFFFLKNQPKGRIINTDSTSCVPIAPKSTFYWPVNSPVLHLVLPG